VADQLNSDTNAAKALEDYRPLSRSESLDEEHILAPISGLDSSGDDSWLINEDGDVMNPEELEEKILAGPAGKKEECPQQSKNFSLINIPLPPEKYRDPVPVSTPALPVKPEISPNFVDKIFDDISAIKGINPIPRREPFGTNALLYNGPPPPPPFPFTVGIKMDLEALKRSGPTPPPVSKVFNDDEHEMLRDAGRAAKSFFQRFPEVCRTPVPQISICILVSLEREMHDLRRKYAGRPNIDVSVASYALAYFIHRVLTRDFNTRTNTSGFGYFRSIAPVNSIQQPNVARNVPIEPVGHSYDQVRFPQPRILCDRCRCEVNRPDSQASQRTPSPDTSSRSNNYRRHD